MWLILAFTSAALLGFYDVFKKKSLRDNAVIPVLFLNTLFCSLIFLPFILGSAWGMTDTDNLFYIPPTDWGAQDVYKRQEYEVLIEGNTDTDPISRPNIRNNWDLSTLRASSVVQALQNTYGVDPKRLTAAGRGEYNPCLLYTSSPNKRSGNHRKDSHTQPEVFFFYSPETGLLVKQMRDVYKRQVWW